MRISGGITKNIRDLFQLAQKIGDIASVQLIENGIFTTTETHIGDGIHKLAPIEGITTTQGNLNGWSRQYTRLDQVIISSFTVIDITHIFLGRPGNHGMDKAIALNLNRVENGLCRVFLQDDLNPVIQCIMSDKRVILIRREGIMLGQILLHHAAAVPGSTSWGDNGFAII